jgi:hypothetical protein
MEPRYTDEPFDDGEMTFGAKRPKWMIPQTEFEKKVLDIFGMQYYPKTMAGNIPTHSKEMRFKLILIGKSMVSLEMGKDVEYPTEWVMSVLKWYHSLHLVGWRGLKAFLNSCHDREWRSRFVAEWRKKRATANYQENPQQEFDFSRYLRLPGEE